MRLTYIARDYTDCLTAGNKAKSDYEHILASEGAVNLGLAPSTGNTGAVHFIRNLSGIFRFWRKVRTGDVVVVQYPMKKYFELVCDIAHRRGAKVATLIHDLGSCRRKKLSLERELCRLAKADYVWAANDAMAEHLRNNGLAEQTRVLAFGLHDYLSDSSPVHIPSDSPGVHNRIAYAGTLSLRKNEFVLQLDEIIDFPELHVFGNMQYDSKLPSNVIIHPFMASDDFIAKARLTADWGLVWDGASLDECDGDWGSYLLLNSPHKASFYLRAGLPLIVWSHSAIATIVREKGIGIAVDSLRDIGPRISAISPADYEAMVRRVEMTADDLAKGQGMKNLINHTLELERTAHS